MSLGRWSLSLAVGLLLLGGCASARIRSRRTSRSNDGRSAVIRRRASTFTDHRRWATLGHLHSRPQNTTQLVANLHATSRSGARSASDRTCARARGCHCPRSAASFLAQRTRTDLEGR